MNVAGAMRRALIDLDIPLVRKVWQFISPHLPQPVSDEDALVSMHVARTASKSVPLNLRAYSHAWLRERGLPSQMPDELKPSAERLYPVVVGAVGISVNSKHVEVQRGVHGAMRGVVLDCYANGDDDPKIVKPRMMEARRNELKGLYGLRGK